MAENKMSQVAALFGKKLGERFTIIRGNKKLDARFMRYGFDLMGAYENPYMDLDFYPMRRKTPSFSSGDISRVLRIYVSN